MVFDGEKRLARAERCEERAKVDGKITDYGVRITAQATSGRDAVAPLPAGGARERQLGWHAVPTLPRYSANSNRGN